jgi:hypothetical protein
VANLFAWVNIFILRNDFYLDFIAYESNKYYPCCDTIYMCWDLAPLSPANEGLLNCKQDSYYFAGQKSQPDG